ncbi:hypothetical protein [Pontibacillus sp. HMF3514]|uniref:hypothetical protein n=1 Tax=Pontibacillus sp. HMF3514 TaxID=2692425 RepID=UPI0013201217|nr:hypothetical protein [Pontibacillus sp. HMF3514]QHE51829.1 hypothetical protein GS400_07185 [Pontibacillus sp. HMF3514]
MRVTISYLVVLLGLLSVPQFASAQSGLFSEVGDTVEETTDTVTGEKESEESSSTSSSNTTEEDSEQEDTSSESTKTDSSSEQEETSLTDDVTEDVDKTIKDTKDTADSTLNHVEDTVGSTTKNVTDTVDETTKVVDQVTETVKNQVDNTADSVEDVMTPPNDTVNNIINEAAEKVQDPTLQEKVTEPVLDKNPKKELPGTLIPTKEPRTEEVNQKGSQDRTTSERNQSLKETKEEPQQPVTPAPIPNKDAVVPNPSPSMQNSESQQNVNGSVQVFAIASKPTDLNQSVMNVLHGKASFFFTQWMNAPPSEPPQISSFLPNV